MSVQPGDVVASGSIVTMLSGSIAHLSDRSEVQVEGLDVVTKADDRVAASQAAADARQAKLVAAHETYVAAQADELLRSKLEADEANRKAEAARVSAIAAQFKL